MAAPASTTRQLSAPCARSRLEDGTGRSPDPTPVASAAAIYSLIETAKLHGLDPEAYLRHVLERIADYPISRVSDLLPWNTTGIHPRLDQRIAA